MEKELKIFGKEIIPEGAIAQIESAMDNEFVVKGALMPDAHEGYSLPIGWVIATKDVVVPAWVGYDIWCWMSAICTGILKKHFNSREKEIFDTIYKKIPVSQGVYNKVNQDVDLDSIPKTKVVEDILKKHHGLKQIGSLWGGNHFIEISYDEQDLVWIVIHSGSRGIGHKIASYYMDLAKEKNFSDVKLLKKLENEFDENPKYENLKIHNIEKYEEIKWITVSRQIAELSKWNSEGHYGLNVNSEEGKNYFIDMSFWLEYALLNRELMLKKVLKIIEKAISQTINVNFTLKEEWGDLINRNHNHCVLKDWLYIHRKWATHSELGMYGVIPWNMRDGAFIVKGKGNKDSLESSSHGAWRKYGRKEAMKKIELEAFERTMKEHKIFAKVEESTKDESPFAYKDIFEVMKYQDENVEILHYLKPFINIKG